MLKPIAFTRSPYSPASSTWPSMFWRSPGVTHSDSYSGRRALRGRSAAFGAGTQLDNHAAENESSSTVSCSAFQEAQVPLARVREQPFGLPLKLLRCP